MNKNKILKMKEWMFELTGDWNVFLFEGEGLIVAYKATVEVYKKSNEILPSPPFDERIFETEEDCEFYLPDEM